LLRTCRQQATQRLANVPQREHWLPVVIAAYHLNRQNAFSAALWQHLRQLFMYLIFVQKLILYNFITVGTNLTIAALRHNSRELLTC